MTMLFMDSFDHYGPQAQAGANPGNGATVMSQGVYTGTSQCFIDVPTWGARTGPYSLLVTQGGAPRKVLDGGTLQAMLVGAGVSVSALPIDNTNTSIFIFRDASNATLWSLRLESTGTIALVGVGGVTVRTQAPVIVAANWHFVECKIDTVGQTFRLDVDGVTVINASGLGFTSQAIAAVVVGSVGAGTVGGNMWLDDFTIRDTAGTHNNDFEGDLRIATLFPNANGTNQGWTPQYRHKLGTGILDAHTGIAAGQQPGIYCANSASLDIGVGDFTLEGFFRFAALPTASNKAHLFGKWDEVNNRRSYQLYLGGPTLENGNIVFRTSTSGAAGTVVEKISYPWPNGAPDLDTWYNIAVVRAAGELLLFIDGVQYGLPIADPDTYFAGAEPYSTGVQVQGVNTPTAATGMNGWVDEVRLTMGVGRYTGNFAVTTVPFPRNVGGDPDFASVTLLCGFDSGINDESSYARTVNATGGAVQLTPDDGAFAFQAIYHHTPQDDTFIEAALTPAGSILTLAAQPAPNDTVTVGTYTNAGSHAAVYKFVAALVTAFDVLIGAAVTDTLFNLRAAINLTAGSAGTLYGTGTFINNDVLAAGLPGAQMGVTALLAGSDGNAIASTTSLTNGGGWTGATLAGGADIPSNSEFFFDRPAQNTTVIRAVQIMNRSFKTDAGTGSIQASFVGPLGAVVNGATDPLTVSPVYRWDVFEEDPDTSGSITPATIVEGRVRIDRTE